MEVKVLVATARSQGRRASDRMECVEGELVYLLEPCPESRRFPYSGCPCGISFIGMSSDLATTTAEVLELELTREEFVGCLVANHELRRSVECTCDFDAELIADQVLGAAEPLRPGTIVERLVDHVRVRRLAGR